MGSLRRLGSAWRDDVEDLGGGDGEVILGWLYDFPLSQHHQNAFNSFDHNPHIQDAFNIILRQKEYFLIHELNKRPPARVLICFGKFNNYAKEGKPVVIPSDTKEARNTHPFRFSEMYCLACHDWYDTTWRIGKSVLLLDGLEYIITNNEFINVLRLIDNIKELVSLHKSTLLLPLNSTAFSDKEITLIRKNMIDLTDVKVNVEKFSS